MDVLGYQQITALSSAVAPTIPAGTRKILAQAEVQHVRWRNDGTSPTADIGMLILTTAGQPTEFIIDNGFDDLKFIEDAASARLNLTYLGKA
jgi:hypothetical protein